MSDIIGLEQMNPTIQGTDESQTLFCGMFYRNDCPDASELLRMIGAATRAIILQKYYNIPQY